MSDLSLTRDALHRAASQLPVASYFDGVLYQRELETLFRPGTRYIGHDLCVPALGDFHTLAQEGEGRALVRTADGVELLSNVCRHRQALMLNGRGSTHGKPGSIVCPLHRWTYDLHGRLIGAPHFEQDPCLHLANYPLPGAMTREDRVSLEKDMILAFKKLIADPAKNLLVIMKGGRIFKNQLR